MAHGRAGREAFASALCRLGARGLLILSELPDGRLLLSLPPARDAAAPLAEDERWLREALAQWSRTRAVPDAAGLREAVVRQAAAEKALTPAQWARARRFSRLPPLAARAMPAEQRAAALAMKQALSRYPDPEERLPGTRGEWDDALAYAAALGLAQGFLSRAREANELLARHYQGIVATFCTPGWFREARMEERERFSYLTDGLARALTQWEWRRVQPA